MKIARQSAPNDQVEAVAFLSSPAAYAGRPMHVERHETHGAFVFATETDAYKIKRAVRFSYMDFSTLERRRQMLEREFTINQRFAPDIYLGVTPITRETDGRLRIGGTGARTRRDCACRDREQRVVRPIAPGRETHRLAKHVGTRRRLIRPRRHRPL